MYLAAALVYCLQAWATVQVPDHNKKFRATQIGANFSIFISGACSQ